jgi:F-type H+-transporting ATPase subunit epsilon
MSKTLQLEIVTPDRLVLSEEVDYVGAPGYEGEFGIMSNHIPFLSALQIGNLFYKKGGRNYYVFVAGGFAEISNNKVTILAEVAEKAAEIDLQTVQSAKERAEERMRQYEDEKEHARARAQLARAMARMKCREAATAAGTCEL